MARTANKDPQLTMAKIQMLVVIVLLTPFPALQGEPTPVNQLEIETQSLRAVVTDNQKSPEHLSGLQSLFHRRDAPTFDAYDPDTLGASAGLNFEHIISGHRDESNRFTPRHDRYVLRQESPTSCVLIRNAEDSPWKVGSRFRYTFSEPNAVDFDFRCQFIEPELFAPHNYAVFFFANYMNDVQDSAIYFRGIEDDTGKENWIRAHAPEGHPDYNGGGTYQHRISRGLSYDEDHDFKLNLWSYEYPRFTQPFYFGKAANEMSLQLMFDRTVTRQDEIRFSLFKFKLRKHPRPAWDFQYVVKDIQPDTEYGFQGRLIWKRFVSPEDCEQEYNRWTESLKN